jgi:hypothetical protein
MIRTSETRDEECGAVGPHLFFERRQQGRHCGDLRQSEAGAGITVPHFLQVRKSSDSQKLR